MSKKFRKNKKKQRVKIPLEIQEKFRSAVSFRQMGLLGQAQQALSEIIAKAPDYLDSYFLSAEIAMQAGQANHAISIIKIALTHNQHNPICHGFLADLLAQNGCYADAIPHYEKALSLSHRNKNIALDQLLLQTSFAYKNSGEPLKAIAKLKMALKQNDKNTRIYFNLASIYLTIGHINDAKRYAILSLDIDPLFSNALRILSIIDIDYFNKSLIEMIIEKIDSPITPVEDKINYSFTLYAIFESTSNFKESFKYLSIGNNLKRETTPYNFENQALYFKKAREFFSKCLMIHNTPPPLLSLQSSSLACREVVRP